MKKLLIVIGDGFTDSATIFNVLLIRFPIEDRKGMIFTAYAGEKSPKSALEDVLDIINSGDGSVSVDNIVVGYGGTNLYLLKDKLPCKSFDIQTLYKKINEAVDNNDPKYKETTRIFFTGAVMNFLNVE